MKILSRDSMREADRKTIEEFGMSGAVLMETAGMRISELVFKKLQKNARVTVLAGQGNNGGDGLVAARLLNNAGYAVSLWCASKPDGYRAEAAVNAKYLKKADFPIKYISASEDLVHLKEDLECTGLVIDALLGIGVDRDVSGFPAEVIDTVNACSAPVLAVDIPSGVNADTGAVMGCAIKADWTVTFAAPKLGLLLHPGAGLAGEIFVADINVPVSLLEDEKVNLVTVSLVKAILPERPINAHKGSVGRVLIVAGSPGMTGAAVMTAESAFKGGAGLVYLAAPESICSALEAKMMEVIIVPLPEQSKGIISPEAAEVILEKAKQCDALAIGPGLDTGDVTSKLLKKLVQLSPVPMVLDAGALAALGKKINMLRSARYLPVITPHPGEMARMTGVSAGQIQSSRLDVAIKNTRLWECIIMLKGPNTVIAEPGGRAFVNPTGNQSLSTAGSGDLLTGLVTSFIAQGIPSDSAAAAAAFVHGLSGDLILPGRGHMARDVLANYKTVFRFIDQYEDHYEGNPYLKKVRPV